METGSERIEKVNKPIDDVLHDAWKKCQHRFAERNTCVQPRTNPKLVLSREQARLIAKEISIGAIVLAPPETGHAAYSSSLLLTRVTTAADELNDARKLSARARSPRRIGDAGAEFNSSKAGFHLSRVVVSRKELRNIATEGADQR